MNRMVSGSYKTEYGDADEVKAVVERIKVGGRGGGGGVEWGWMGEGGRLMGEVGWMNRNLLVK